MKFSKPRDGLIGRSGALAVFTVCILVVSCGGGGGSGSNNFNNGGSGIAQQVAACEATLPQLQTPAFNNEASVIVDGGPCAYGVPFGSPPGTAPG